MKTRISAGTDAVCEAAALLAEGQVVGLPTETVYGLGGSALDPLACARIFEAKERPLSDPLIVHLPSRDWVEKLAQPSALALKLAEAFWPGPLTMVLPRQKSVPDLVTAGQDTVAVRMSGHPVFQAVAETFGMPIAAPSANRFGRISPTTAEHVLAELDGRISLIVNGGPCTHGIESTIVLIREEELHILRHGPITKEQLEVFGSIAPFAGDIASPGNLKSHYAPRTPLDVIPAGISPEKSAGLLSWSHSGEGFGRVEYLSRSQDLEEAAANLYGAMRRLDESGVERIVAEPVPETGLGVAIMERLRKAAARE